MLLKKPESPLAAFAPWFIRGCVPGGQARGRAISSGPLRHRDTSPLVAALGGRRSGGLWREGFRAPNTCLPDHCRRRRTAYRVVAIASLSVNLLSYHWLSLRLDTRREDCGDLESQIG